jgi:hypothetical protein
MSPGQLPPLEARQRRPLSYDRSRRQVPGDAEATRLLKRSCRAPWKHPAAALG